MASATLINVTQEHYGFSSEEIFLILVDQVIYKNKQANMTMNTVSTQVDHRVCNCMYLR